MTRPFHAVNILTGIKEARVMEDGRTCAELIKKAKHPLLIVGPRILVESLGEKRLVDYALDLASAADIPICATAHTKKTLLEKGCTPDCSYDLVEIVNSLKKKEWQGVRGEGTHDLVLFLGFRTDLEEACLSTLKHYAPHLKTMTIDRFYYPNANYSSANIRKDEKWKDLLEETILNLREN